MIADCPVDQFAQDVDVPDVPGGLLDHVNQHPPQRHRLAGPRRTEILDVELVDHAVGSGPCSPVEVDDVGGRLVYLDAEVGVLVVLVARQLTVAARRYGRSVTTFAIQLVMLSTRAVVSSEVCGQLGPLLSTDTSSGAEPDGVRQYGAPESYTQALVSAAG